YLAVPGGPAPNRGRAVIAAEHVGAGGHRAACGRPARGPPVAGPGPGRRPGSACGRGGAVRIAVETERAERDQVASRSRSRLRIGCSSCAPRTDDVSISHSFFARTNG